MATPEQPRGHLLRKPGGREIGQDVHRLPDWSGERVAIVCSGQSASRVDFTKIKDRMRVVAVNTSWELVPWADVLYACDFNWWQVHRGAPDFHGLKITADKIAMDYFPRLVRIEVKSVQIGNDAWDDRPLFDHLGQVASGANGGYQMLNLVAQLGATGIALIGCDLHGEHWHGRHPPPCTNPMERYFVRWRLAFDNAATHLAERGSDVVNCSPVSTLKAYPVLTVDEMIERWSL
jgi:hypothetical protein